MHEAVGPVPSARRSRTRFMLCVLVDLCVSADLSAASRSCMHARFLFTAFVVNHLWLYMQIMLKITTFINAKGRGKPLDFHDI